MGPRPYPSCGRCGYDVSGSIGSVTRCPECGTLFAEAGIRPPGRGLRTRIGARVAGVGLLVLGLACLGTGVSAQLAAQARLRAEQARAAAAQQAAVQTQLQAIQALAEQAERLRDEGRAEVDEGPGYAAEAAPVHGAGDASDAAPGEDPP